MKKLTREEFERDVRPLTRTALLRLIEDRFVRQSAGRKPEQGRALSDVERNRRYRQRKQQVSNHE